MQNKTGIRIYQDEISKIPVLTDEEERQVAEMASQGDEKAIEKLVVSNLRFAFMIARRYSKREPNVPLPDLVREGNLGLMHAAEKYDWKIGNRFISYAVWWINNYIKHYLLDKNYPVSQHVFLEAMGIDRHIEGLAISGCSREESKRKTALLYRKSPSELEESLKSLKPHISLNIPLNNFGEDGSKEEIIDILESPYSAPEETAVNSQLKEDIKRLLSQLPEREREILKYRYGIDKTHPHTLEEVGEIYRMTKEGIRQVEKRALITLRRIQSVNSLAGYLR